jgi:serine/threonine protein phosphatase 1
MILYAIGDIHGMKNHLITLLSEIDKDIHTHKQPSKIIFVGDYVDRGPDSAGVIDLLINRNRNSPEHIEHIFLMGNHEDMLLNDKINWMFNGGKQTVESYGLEPYIDDFVIPNEHEEFFEILRYYYQYDRYLFVHAGIFPYMKVEDANPFSLMWERKMNGYNGDYDYGYHVTHGHTPSKNIGIAKNTINIDTACVFGGCLTAVKYDTNNIPVKPEFIQTVVKDDGFISTKLVK